jgi:hypothetical protein
MAMNHFRKKAAVEKYTAKAPELSSAELLDLIKGDEKKYTDEEVNEIVDAIDALNNSVEKAEADYYEEWDCKIVKGVAEKLKRKRTGISITDEQAEILNTGVLNGGNNYALMYFKPE